ncbi:sigma-70 family RNA polymerase sigma factor [Thermomonas sp.]|uniref:sigma-70 family RNA polymerase sigma factor n=1 Tax=Thermomonas sp. TaxID=1971895 RepID=UPI002C37741D|nr:sigma-70 family RNA polymerase sigma factor [Thermomonas sp.]HRO63580.1 sigma-70 family RNA polymerase sigma factor [Thermomonas sp.]
MAFLEDEADLWRRLREANDRTAHQLLFSGYSAWARSVARDVFRRVKISQLDWADYSQNAAIGLLEAMERYDHTRRIDFIAYAKPRVRGAVFNGLREFLAENRQVAPWESRWEERRHSLQGQDSADELERFVLLVSGLAVGHLLDTLGESEFMEHSRPVEYQVDAHKIGLRLREAIRQLPEKEKLVIELHYLQHMPFVEVAGLVGVTKGRISQLHKAAMARLRESSSLRGFQDAL